MGKEMRSEGEKVDQVRINGERRLGPMSEGRSNRGWGQLTCLQARVRLSSGRTRDNDPC